uniref:Uncharacterized protein n=1 Tax=Salmonella enterica subsp. salamae TaxID=59202 RepID=I3W436_SALER|nr:hypothetical protein [Salmonella enterica subsp. salamae]
MSLNQTRITGMDNQILLLYAKGMTTRELADRVLIPSGACT